MSFVTYAIKIILASFEITMLQLTKLLKRLELPESNTEKLNKRIINYVTEIKVRYQKKIFVILSRIRRMIVS